MGVQEPGEAGPPAVRSTLPLCSCAVSRAKQPTPCYHHHCLTRRDTRGTEKPTAHVSVIAANARAVRYSPFPIASTQAIPPAMTAKSKSSDAAHRDGMEIRVTPPSHAVPRGIRSPKSGCAACSLPPPGQIGPARPLEAAHSAYGCDVGGDSNPRHAIMIAPSGFSGLRDAPGALRARSPRQRAQINAAMGCSSFSVATHSGLLGGLNQAEDGLTTLSPVAPMQVRRAGQAVRAVVVLVSWQPPVAL